MFELPFSRTAFFDVFAAYNDMFWPMAAVLWFSSCAVVAGWVFRRPLGGRTLSAVLAVLWVWGGLAYHAWLFARINPAAPLFAGLFLVEGLLLAWFGVARNRIEFRSGGGAWQVAGTGLALYALAYPFVNLLLGHQYPRVPTFGVPCPTTILTIGLLLTTEPGRPRAIVAIPIVWGLIGGSAALLLGVAADYVLIFSGVLLGIHTMATTRRPSRAPLP